MTIKTVRTYLVFRYHSQPCPPDVDPALFQLAHEIYESV